MVRKYSLITVLFFASFIFLRNAKAVTVICSVPVTLHNSQTTPTPANFQQMLTVNSSTYSANENAGLQNVEFSTGINATGTILQGWIESGATNASTNTVYWVNLGATVIPASSSITIYMNFMSGSVMSSAGPIGEAPQLSASYGSNDNGNLVFTIYSNWAGTSLPAGWVASVGGSATYSVNNGLTCNGGSGSSVFIYYNSAQTPIGYLIDSYYTSGTAASDGHDELIGWGLSPTPTNFVGGSGFGPGWWGWVSGAWCGLHQSEELGAANGGSVTQINPLNISTTYPVIVTASWQSNANNTAMFNYANLQTNTTNIPAIASSYPVGGFLSSGGTYVTTWWRERLLPPNSVMPTITLAGPTCVLPVQLLYFNCDKGSNGITLNWATATETNNKEFTIERSNDGLSSFTKIATIPGAGNSVDQLNYSYSDIEPLPGANYYRLLQTDFDGNTTTYNITECNSSDVGLQVYPNPSSDIITVMLPTAFSKAPTELSIMNMTGQQVYSTQVQGTQQLNINVSLYPPSVYLLRATNEYGTQVQKIVVQH